MKLPKQTNETRKKFDEKPYGTGKKDSDDHKYIIKNGQKGDYKTKKEDDGPLTGIKLRRERGY
jgi:hypothetical protein